MQNMMDEVLKVCPTSDSEKSIDDIDNCLKEINNLPSIAKKRNHCLADNTKVVKGIKLHPWFGRIVINF